MINDDVEGWNRQCAVYREYTYQYDKITLDELHNADPWMSLNDGIMKRNTYRVLVFLDFNEMQYRDDEGYTREHPWFDITGA